MLGIPDFSIWLVYLLCILSTVACIVYGLLNWNEGAEDEMTWAEEEFRLRNEEEVKMN